MGLWVSSGAFAMAATGADAVIPPGLASELERVDRTIGAGPYRPEWTSLKAHKDPEWFRDAKFGIYTHWGPVSVGAEDGPGGVQWYGKNMYEPKSPTSSGSISSWRP